MSNGIEKKINRSLGMQSLHMHALQKTKREELNKLHDSQWTFNGWKKINYESLILLNII